MALTKCSECGKEVSDKAATCPSCGNPINSAPIPSVEKKNTKPVEVELTSKKWKKVHLASWGMIIGGLVFMANDPAHKLGFWFGVDLIIFGVIVRYIGKIGAWWSNR